MLTTIRRDTHILKICNMMLLKSQQPTLTSPQAAGYIKLTVVVPCYNEEAGLDQLADKLKALKSHFSERLDLEVIFVDDGSTDKTAAGLDNRFQQFPWARVIRHDRNLGIAAAILTGIESASNELVASLDADCTYDPLQINSLVEMMVDDVAMVTASPYHPEGCVEGIPRWRLVLSKSASTCYAILLGTSLHTYTSCFRVYRRSFIRNLEIRERGFVGVAELLWQIQKNGGKIVEAPARLTSRRVGFSKLRTIPVIFSHFKLMNRILFHRFFGR